MAIYSATYRSLALTALNAVITRPDGCALRNTPDTIALGGTGVDFISTCPIQAPIYACLKDAQAQLSAPSSP